jgi:hypothetical protein
MAFGAPPAYMGFVGFVRVPGLTITSSQNEGLYTVTDDFLIRATSADLSLKQAIDKPDVIDSRFDRTVYKLGPQEVDGGIAFPAVYGTVPALANGVSIDSSSAEAFFRMAVTRRANGTLNDMNVDVKYAASNTAPNQAEFRYKFCYVNTYQFAVTQGDMVNISVDIMGVKRDLSDGNLDAPINADLVNTRAVTWNDARVEIRKGDGGRLGSSSILGDYVRTFEFNVNNNLERFYTLNQNLFAQAIAPTKRDIDGSFEILGRHQDLAALALDNQNYCQEVTEIAFGFTTNATGDTCTSTFNTIIPNCVFFIEEMSLSNDLFVTNVNWTALLGGGSGEGVTDPLLDNINTAVWTPISFD